MNYLSFVTRSLEIQVTHNVASGGSLYVLPVLTVKHALQTGFRVPNSISIYPKHAVGPTWIVVHFPGNIYCVVWIIINHLPFQGTRWNKH